MKPITYISGDGLKDTPFPYCGAREDEGNKSSGIYYQGRLVLHDYNHCGHYLYAAAVLLSRTKNKMADWANLGNLWTLRDCVRENYSHDVGAGDIILGENFDGKNLGTFTPLTRKGLDCLCRRIRGLDPYAII